MFFKWIFYATYMIIMWCISMDRENITFQMMYNMLLYLKDSQRKTKKALIDCRLSLMGKEGTFF